MASNRKLAPWQRKLRALLQKPATLPILAAICGLIIVAIAAIVVWFTVLGGKPADDSGSTSWSEPASDASYDATAGKVDVEAYEGTVLAETEDAGQEYLDETLFLGDSNTVRYMVYGPEGNEEPFTTIDNNIGVVSMGVQQIATLKCENFVGRSSAVTMPEAVKIMQPRRVIIGFGTNNLTMNVDTFIEEYKEGLASDAAINAIPFSVCLLRAESADAAKTLAEQVEEKANPRKWVCVEAESKIVDRIGDVVILIMADKTLADQLSANFKALAD